MTRLERLARTRLYLILTLSGSESAWLPALETALASTRIGMLQVRAKTIHETELRRVLARIRPYCLSGGCLLLLNDNAALAAALNLDGAHVGQADLPVREARSLLGPERLLGLSTHDPAEIEAARDLPVDYLGLGPCFATDSKQLEREPQGPDLVTRCLPGAGDRPLFPIGGITPDNAASLAAAGARRLAVGAGILAAPDPAAAAQALDALLRRAPSD